MIILLNRTLRSSTSLARQRIAITSEATVISKPVCLGLPSTLPPKPTTVFLNWR